MLNKIIHFSLHNRLVVLLASAVLFICGIYTAYHTEVDVFPDLNAPTVVVMTEAAGMAAQEVEQLVTLPVETAVNGANGVRRVRSSSTAGFSVVWVEFDWDMDRYLARQIVSEKLASIEEALPASAGRPTLGPQSSILGEVMIVGLTSDTTSLLDLRTLADWTIRPRLLSLGGVAQVSVLGGDIKEYQISLHPERMQHYGVRMADIVSATEEMNRNTGGGVVYEFGNEYIVRGVLATSHVQALAQTVIRTVTGKNVRLEQVADVRIGARQPKLGVASEKGKPAVLLTVTKQPHTGTIALTGRIEESLSELRQTLPPDVHVSTDVFRQSRFIESSIANVKHSLYEGAFFVVIVLLLFLANIRTTFISLLTLPISLVVTILVLHYMGISINTMSLGGMAIAIGSLVDDAIVDVENVWKHLRENRLDIPGKGRSLLQVVYDASCEVRMPILNSTLIIVVSFLPLFFLHGMEGRMLIPLGVAFIISLFASTLVALTLTPVLCSLLLRSGYHSGKSIEREGFLPRRLKHYYSRSLLWALNRKRMVISAVAVMFIGALGSFLTLGHSFLPSFNEGSFTINISSLPGISLEESDKIGKQAEEILLTIPEIKTVARKTGRAELDEHALGVNVSEIEAPFELHDSSHKELLETVRRKLSVLQGVNIEIGQPISHRIDAMLSGTQASIAIKLFGDDLNKLYSLGNRIKEAVSDVKGVADLNVEQQVERPELSIVPRREMLSRYGITPKQFSQFIEVNLAGKAVSQVNEDGKTFDLVLRASDESRCTIESLHEMMIDGEQGIKIPLSSVAEIRSTKGPNVINRENVKRKIVISANTQGRDLRSVVNDIRSRIEKRITLPQGYHIEYGGQFESEISASRTLMLASAASLIIIFLLLFMQFHNVKQSAVILLNLPLALIGGVFALFITSGEISIPAVIGFISLFGIATRNGMLLISHYHSLHANDELSLRELIIKGSLDRFNPILMTALSSALALIPLAWRGDLPGNEIQSPMAIVILGGLLTSTFLNAFIIPVVYELLHSQNHERKDVCNQIK